MLTNLKIPVINTEKGKYDYDGVLTREEYDDMVINKFNSTNRQMNQFVDNIAMGISNVDSMRTYHGKDESEHPEILYDMKEVETFIQNSKKEDIEENFFLGHLEKEDMFILILNMNPNSMDGDTESELRFWLDDSRKIHQDTTIDNQSKLRFLPKRTFFIEINKKNAMLMNCKVLQDYSNGKWPFYFAVIVEKIMFN